MEALCAQLSANLASFDEGKDGPRPTANSIMYDGRGGNLYSFFQLDSFDGTIIRYDILKGSTANGTETEITTKSDPTVRPTLRIFISSNEQLIVLNNFEVLPGSIKTVDGLMERPSCKLPHALWVIRSSALVD